MNLNRLMALGLLARSGPRHGHQLRLEAEAANASNWGGVSIGALYRELRAMVEEGLLETVRTEQVGRRPARTVYRITEAGQEVLRAMRREAICDLHIGPDVFGVALLFGRDAEREELIALLDKRRSMLAATRDALAAECARLEQAGHIGPIDVAMFRRRQLQLDAELRWLEEFAPVLTGAAPATPSDSGNDQ
ncbi:PadR family transcriptional regulator [Actinomadura sp. ATCC 31491]|uniref:PadR family transcriptional regulator n=1 Tax=Actinomadura luzonensis TaxID=2805427 RepID=A0ABT0G935_9ACTN|nr:PadR family transcriptional regulator [Actinomadura luzonensis]MCK2221102.1 PadR family transcriptional regulator [Actinomadura luzonensis]